MSIRLMYCTCRKNITLISYFLIAKPIRVIMTLHNLHVMPYEYRSNHDIINTFFSSLLYRYPRIKFESLNHFRCHQITVSKRKFLCFPYDNIKRPSITLKNLIVSLPFSMPILSHLVKHLFPSPCESVQGVSLFFL